MRDSGLYSSLVMILLWVESGTFLTRVDLRDRVLANMPILGVVWKVMSSDESPGNKSSLIGLRYCSY